MTVYIIFGLLTFLFNFSYSADKRSVDRRIVGGLRTSIQYFPYQASLTAFGEHYCGGSVISEYWILTAGHCVEDIYDDPSELVIRMGSSIRTHGKAHKVEKIHLHPSYNDVTLDYDFALLKLKKPIEYSQNVQPIGLAEPEDQLKEGDMLLISGWGYTEDGVIPTKLLAVAVPFIKQDTCKKQYKGITDRMFCAGYLRAGGKDACQGDSGGPLVAFGKQYGVISWGTGCAQASYPGVYAKISDQREWINKTAGV